MTEPHQPDPAPLMYVMGTMMGTGLAFPIFFFDTDKPWPRWKKILFPVHLLLGLTFWLWCPWLIFALSNLYTWNIGKVHDCEPETKVQEPAVRERPSAADAEKQ